MKIWEELLMLEQRILCDFLPLNFHQMENFTAPLSYSPLIQKQQISQFQNKHSKIIQEGKRKWLNLFLNVYEIQLQEYEQKYQSELQQLEQTQIRNQFTTVDSSTLLNNIKQYLIYQTNRFKEDIYQKMPSFRDKLVQNRQRSSKTKTTIGVSPEPYLDLAENPFNKSEWNQLSLGKKYEEKINPFLHIYC